MEKTETGVNAGCGTALVAQRVRILLPGRAHGADPWFGAIPHAADSHGTLAQLLKPKGSPAGLQSLAPAAEAEPLSRRRPRMGSLSSKPERAPTPCSWRRPAPIAAKTEVKLIRNDKAGYALHREWPPCTVHLRGCGLQTWSGGCMRPGPQEGCGQHGPAGLGSHRRVGSQVWFADSTGPSGLSLEESGVAKCRQQRRWNQRCDLSGGHWGLLRLPGGQGLGQGRHGPH